MEHYHCSLCGQSYPTREAAHECLVTHTELEILRYIAYEIYCEKSFSRRKKRPVKIPWAVWDIIDEINNKFEFAETEDDGSIWNKVIKGTKR